MFLMTTVNYELIILARETMGLTQAELADMLYIKQSTMSKIEHGLLAFPISLTDKLVEILPYPKSFFYQDWKPVRVEGHYRKKMSLSVKSVKEYVSKMTMAERHFISIIDSVEMPDLNYPKWNVNVDGSPSLCAQHLREFWKIPKGRIDNLTDLIENNGIPIIELYLGQMDGFTTLSKCGTPIIFINRSRPGDRDLLTKAHELFHVIAHFGQVISSDRDIDKEATEFASELLFPEKNARQDLSKINLPKLVDLKKYWRVSMGSMIMKAKQLSLITQDQYSYLWKQMGAMGYRTKEPIETHREVATLFQEMLTTYLENFAYSKEEFEKVLQFPSSLIDEWYFNRHPSKLKIIRKIG